MKKRRTVKAALIALVSIWILGVPVIVYAEHSASPGSFGILTRDDDSFYNWDFDSQTADSSNVDWPVTILYHNNAEVDKVKSIYWGLCGSGSQKYARLNDGNEGTGWVWDEDGGTKNPCSCLISGDAEHMRVYADANDTMYNLS